MHRRQIKGPDAKTGKQRVQGVDNEVSVLEAYKEQQVDAHGRYHEWFHRRAIPVTLNQQSKDVVDRDGGRHDKGIERFPPGIKEEARHKQPGIPPFARQEHIKAQHQREEEKEKDRRGEKHEAKEITAI